MFSHVMLGANDIPASKTFYDAILGAIGGRPGRIDPKGRVLYIHNGGMLLLTKPLNGEAACHGNGSTIGFTCENPEQVDAWHAAGLAAGGTLCEDPPGPRTNGDIRLYLAYLRDPAGNKLCAVHRLPS